MRCEAPRSGSPNIRTATRGIVLIGLAVFLGAGTARAEAPSPGTEDPNNWPQYHRTYNAWRYSPLDQINKVNVGKLKVAWIHQGGDITMGIQEPPIVIDGVVYSITAGNRVTALDAKTGKELWQYQPKLDPITKKVLFSPYSRGVTVGRGKVFIGTVDGRGIAVDQKTGKEIWQTHLTDFVNCHGCNFTSPPVLANDVLTYGSTAGELATAGKIFGVEADTGKKLWEFETIKQSPGSWSADSGKYGGGGAWMPGTYDPETTGGGLVFNGDPLGIIRAFDTEDGKVLWSFNTGSRLRSGLVSYAVDGKQYLLVPSGWGSYAAVLLPPLFPELEKVPGASTLIAFTLGE